MGLRARYVAGGEFVVNRELDVHGQIFPVGSVLPWRELGMPEQKIREFWKANMVDTAPVGVATPPPARVATAPQPQKRR